MSGPNGDLGMPVDAGTEGENDSFGEAGDLGWSGVAEATLALPGVLSEDLESGGEAWEGLRRCLTLPEWLWSCPHSHLGGDGEQ